MLKAGTVSMGGGKGGKKRAAKRRILYSDACLETTFCLKAATESHEPGIFELLS